MHLTAVFFTCILSTILVHVKSADNTVTVSSNSGPIKGVAVTEKNETVYQFRKIPYAKPPVGHLRFKKPEPYGTWNMTLDATQFGPSCVQAIEQDTVPDLPNTNVSEDCLFLNIYVPRNISKSKNMTVMVWIHGGSFLFGQGMLYDGSYLALSGNVIVVTINYRLNLFGFLSTGDSASVGNYGLWDQLEAIKWVRSNIYAFGGNPSSITIFGESAGSLSIGLHVLYPNDDLFQRAIMESGSGNSFISYTANGPSAARLAGKLLSCDTNNTNIMVDCLRNQSAEALLDVLGRGLNASFDPTKPVIGLVLGPVIDGDFVKSDPKLLISNKTSESYKFFRSKDIMSGTMNGEGSLLLSFLKPYQPIFNFSLAAGIPKSVLCDHVAPVLASDFYNGNPNISDAVCKKYSISNITDIAEQGRQIVSMYGDVMFVSPSVKTLQIHSKDNNQANSYMFHFTHHFSKASGSPYPAWFKFASHATELAYLFAIPKAYKKNITVSEEDIKLSNNMLKYWTNFAKYGNPNGGSLTVWPEFKQDSAYLDLDLNITAKNNLYANRMNFWLKTIPSIEHQQVPISNNITTTTLPASTTIANSTSSHMPTNPSKLTTRIKTTKRNKGTSSKPGKSTKTSVSTTKMTTGARTTTSHNAATTISKAEFAVNLMMWVTVVILARA